MLLVSPRALQSLHERRRRLIARCLQCERMRAETKRLDVRTALCADVIGVRCGVAQQRQCRLLARRPQLIQKRTHKLRLKEDVISVSSALTITPASRAPCTPVNSPVVVSKAVRFLFSEVAGCTLLQQTLLSRLTWDTRSLSCLRSRFHMVITSSSVCEPLDASGSPAPALPM